MTATEKPAAPISKPAVAPAPAVTPAPVAAKPAKPALTKAVAPQTAKPAVKPATKPTVPAKKKVAAKTVTPKAKPVKAPKPAKVAKPKKQKMVRDSMTMPKDEYAVLDVLKTRAAELAQPAKKTELLRAGIKALAAMSDASFLAALKVVPSLKTGRPSKN
jgi:hypothetical protein